jgi:hypothetical protein
VPASVIFSRKIPYSPHRSIASAVLHLRHAEGATEKKVWTTTGLSLFGVFAVFNCALGSLAAGQTSFPPLLGESEESGEASGQGWQSSEGTRPGKMVMNSSGTLILGDPFSAAVNAPRADQERSYAFSADAVQREVFESATQKHFPARTDSADTNFISFPAMATFPESALTEKCALAREITPVAEPGTWIPAGLTAAFLMWKLRKSLKAPFSRRQFIRRPRVFFQIAKLVQSLERGWTKFTVAR